MCVCCKCSVMEKRWQRDAKMSLGIRDSIWNLMLWDDAEAATCSDQICWWNKITSSKVSHCSIDSPLYLSVCMSLYLFVRLLYCLFLFSSYFVGVSFNILLWSYRFFDSACFICALLWCLFLSVFCNVYFYLFFVMSISICIL